MKVQLNGIIFIHIKTHFCEFFFIIIVFGHTQINLIFLNGVPSFLKKLSLLEFFKHFNSQTNILS